MFTVTVKAKVLNETKATISYTNKAGSRESFEKTTYTAMVGNEVLIIGLPRDAAASIPVGDREIVLMSFEQDSGIARAVAFSWK